MRKTKESGQRDPSKRSLREIPEVDFRRVRVPRNRYARPKRLLESGGTAPRSVRFSDEIWNLLAR